MLPASAAASYERLSDEKSSTSWSYVEQRAKVRERPASSAPRVGELRTETFLGSPSTVVVLGRDGLWSRVRFWGIGSRTGWVPSRVLTEPEIVTTRLVISRDRTRLTLFDEGERVMSFRVGVGANGSPTPAGRYYVREKIVLSNPHGIYGPIAFGLSAHSRFRTDWPGGGQVGVHGTDQPGLIPGHISNGCVRLRNTNIRKLASRLLVGTPVLIK